MTNPYDPPKTETRESDLTGELVDEFRSGRIVRLFWAINGSAFIIGVFPLGRFLFDRVQRFEDGGVWIGIGGLVLMMTCVILGSFLNFCFRIRVFENGIEIRYLLRGFCHWEEISRIDLSNSVSVIEFKNGKKIQIQQQLSQENKHRLAKVVEEIADSVPVELEENG